MAKKIAKAKSPAKSTKVEKASVTTMKCAKICQPIGPYRMGKIIRQPGVGTWGYSSGCCGFNKKAELVSKKPGAQAKKAMQNLQACATSNGFKMSDAIKTTVFLTDMSHFAEVNVEYAKFFKNDAPARSCVAVHQLPKGALFEVEAVFFKA